MLWLAPDPGFLTLESESVLYGPWIWDPHLVLKQRENQESIRGKQHSNSSMSLTLINSSIYSSISCLNP